MLKYLIIQLDETSVPFCHYNNEKLKPSLIRLETLKQALLWSMKENLSVQILYPDSQLSSPYKDLLGSVDHTDIISSTCEDLELQQTADYVVFNSWNTIKNYCFSEHHRYLIRTTFNKLFENASILYKYISIVDRLNIVIIDVENINKEIEEKYSGFLQHLCTLISQEYKKGHFVQTNILTDRMVLDNMNNCGAGDESITLGPDGKFYICPGFYLDGSIDVGDPENGLKIENLQLYKLDHAPICRKCDAWHCKRCIWLNRNNTLEVNTPGKEQCVMAHIERNASKHLLSEIKKLGLLQNYKEIPDISYLDPFENIIKNN